MAFKDQLTTERLKRRFNSAFDLVNYSIKLSKEMIHSGRSCRVGTPIHNKAYQILLEIAEDKDKLEEFKFIEEKDDEPAANEDE